uniref:Uncharacterized protein n=1 Tax=Amphimedon queenslandica TaxID=400682 RepID=A0A1X7VRX3_AMPQE
LVTKVRSGQSVKMRDLLCDNINLLSHLEPFESNPAFAGPSKTILEGDLIYYIVVVLFYGLHCHAYT